MSEIVSWGDNTNGQLGDGGDTGRSVPGPVRVLADLAPVTDVVAGSGHVLALLADGTAVAWGRNIFGQCGDASTENRNEPVAVRGLTGVVGIAAGGGQSLFLREDGTVWGCGAGFFGVLGAEHVAVHPVPVHIAGLDNVTQLVSGGGHCLALTEDGSVYSWGRDDYGQLGDGEARGELPGCRTVEHAGVGFRCRVIPTKVDGLTGVRSLAAGGGHSMALLDDGRLITWGFNDRGQLGDGTMTHRHAPNPQEALTGVTAVAGAYHHTVAVRSDGSVWTWGLNDLGQIGDGSTTHRTRPVRVAGLPTVTTVAAKGGGSDQAPGGSGHSYAVAEDGGVWSWGCNNHGELGDGGDTARLEPVAVKDLDGVARITAGGEVPAFRENPGGGYGLAIVGD
jgi:alpha-tubulin suppressor-like RCC1 family protein